ncbi:MAG: CxxC-x17-CxxC domain-containing protein [Patescibacteria group bacterium]
MAYDNDRGGFRPAPIDVSHLGLKCAECGTAITELPFTPDPQRPVYCRDCNARRRKSFRRE